jgi:hypothetical protein
MRLAVFRPARGWRDGKATSEPFRFTMTGKDVPGESSASPLLWRPNSDS